MPPLSQTTSHTGSYFLNGDPAAFDAPFFSITAHEAAAMDPQQRWLLETSYRALENAGIPLEKVAGTNTAVYASSTSEDYIMMTAKDPDHAAQMVATATSPSIQANRISWYFDLRGPSIHVNTACSSSMITVDLACQSLRSGQSSMALLASANSLLSPEWSLYMSNMNFLSPDSRCYSFDHRANGYARSEGVVVLVLKRLSDAIRDGDTIRGVIRGTGSNQDGHTPTMPQPNQSAQEALIRQVYKSCNLGFEKTRYVEAHGTGTQIGDVTEATAIGRVFRSSRSPKEPLYIGSIKANIGHLEGGSGLASILKSIMILEKGIIPRAASFEKLNPKIKAKFYHLEVSTACIPWPTQGLRRISVDSFGFGGANSHVIIDDAFHTIEALALVGNHHTLAFPGLSGGVNGVNHATDKNSKANPGHHLLTWSARDEAALKRMLRRYDEYLRTSSSTHGDAEFLGDIAYTLAARRSLMAWRAFSIVNGLETLDLPAAKCERAARDVGVAFVFTGQGAQYANMGMGLLHYPVFKATLVEIDSIFQSLGAEWSLFDKLRDQTCIDRPEFSQPLCTALQIALVRLLETFNVFPDVIVGHSSGEIAAAYTVGAFSLRCACAAAYHRGRLAGQIAAVSALQPGAMMSVNLAESEAESYLVKASLPGPVSVACINSPSNVTLSGDESAIDQLHKDLEKDGVFARKIRTGVAYHSPAMYHAAGEYLASLDHLEPRELHSGNPIMISTVTSQKVATINLLDPRYWVDNMVSPVRFADALQYIVHTAPKVDGLKPITNFIEIGPHGALQRPVRDTMTHAGNSTARYGSALSRQDPPSRSILQLVGQLFTSGHRVSITAANQQDGPSPVAKPVVDTPDYPFDKTLTYWHEPRLSRDWRLREEPSQSLLGLRTNDWNPLQPRWRKMLNVEEVPWLADHVVGNSIIFPGVGSIVMAIEAVKQTASGNQAIRGYHLKETTFTSPIVVTPGQTTEVMTHLRPLQQSYEKTSTRFEVEIFSFAENYWRACNKHLIHVEFEQETRTEVDGGHELQLLTSSIAHNYRNTKSKANVKIATADFYHGLEEIAFQYGPTFSLTDEIRWDGEHLAIAEVHVGPPVDSYKEGVVHPGVLDSCLQLCLIPPSQKISKNIPTCVPHKIKGAWIAETAWRDPSADRVDVLTEAKLKSTGAGLDCEVAILSKTGALLGYFKRLEMLPIMSREIDLDDSGRKLLHHIDWKPHLSLRPPQQPHDLGNTAIKSPDNEDAAVSDRIELEETLRSVAQRSIDSLQHDEWERMPAHVKKYISWTERQLRGKPNREIPAGCDLISKLQDLGMRWPSWRVFTEAAKSFPSVVREEPQELDLSLSSDIFQDYLDDIVAAVCNQDFEAYLGLLAHQKPTQRILEICARRGALTSYVLSVFQRIEARTGGITYSQYTYSDTLTASLDDARQRFAEHQNRMDFTCLDVNRDLIAQGMQPASYDVIFAAGALRSANNISAVLQNLGRVLTPGGQLVLHEITVPDRFEIGFGFGATADWWCDRQDDGTMTPSQWDAALKDNGFSGTDLVIRDYKNDVLHCSSLMVSRGAAAQPSLPNADTRVLIVIDDDDSFQKALAESLLHNTTWNSRVLTLTEMIVEKLETNNYVVCLADVYRPYLHPMKQQTLKTVRNWVQQCKNLFWVTAYNTESTALSSSYPYTGIKDGFLRTLRSEFALNRIVSLTLGESTRDATTCARYVFDVFESAFIRGLSADVEYMVRDGEILTARLVDDDDTNKALASSLVPQAITEPWLPGPPLRLGIQTRGQLETLRFQEDVEYYEELGPQDVEIEAKAWGLGFRDVFMALGRLEEDDFGIDCAGIVTRVGSEVQSIKVGDRVCAQEFNCMKTYARSREWSTQKISDSVSFEEACAVIMPGMTAIQSLIEVARLQKGEKVLIHSASGGTGQVALQIAQMIGAEVFATVGYDSKKQLLMDKFNVPEDHIFYSRDTSFAQGILRITNGYGVDVVLNSLVGESLRASWDCIAPYGRMIEIGKAEINANASLPMASFAKNTMFAGVDLYYIKNDLNKKHVTRMLLQRTMDLVRDGSVRVPVPLHIYGLDSMEDAFRYLASGKNSGRILIRVDPSTHVQKPKINRRTWKFDGKATYMVAGGLGGIGRSILRWMVTRGARHLLVPSRSGPASAAASEVVRELSDQNIVVSTPKCDVSSKDALSHMLEDAGTTLPPIRGCIVATMALNDCLFENMTLPQWEQTSCSKVESSWNLHTLLPELDFFILLSSVSGVVGNPGQSNYAAGCTFQDALARHRNEGGQKAISIDLGVMRSIGVVAETERLQQHFQNSKAFIQVEEAEFLSLLDICCDPSYHPQGHQCQMVMGLETPASLLARSLEPPEVLQRPLFARFSQRADLSGSSNDGTGDGLDAARLFREADSAVERAQVVVEALSKRLARTLSIKFEDVDTHQALHAYGVDSLIAVELRTWLGKEFAADVSVFEIVSGKTIEAVGELVAKTSRIEKGA
ncbi:polyketide synthase PksD [Lindgomyces ingoldianus]|uniref:Polyketide synthase PksD n=1 Tax=Lindgomyces ingoldianus TaxID=673940 RepID=A0ACB6QUL7_9PLEO|nr:polyketide synthase PksD [Lindgomyces ingoldianus]KAF2470531.1 polyketide synthase PksD [Lindgomyces ingoldianus]